MGLGRGVGTGVAVAGTLVGLGRGVGTGVAVAGMLVGLGRGVGTGVAVAGTLVAVKLGVGKGAVGVDDGSGARVAVAVTSGAIVWLPLKESAPVQVTASAPKIAASSHGCPASLRKLKHFTGSLSWLAKSRTAWTRASRSDSRRDGSAHQLELAVG